MPAREKTVEAWPVLLGRKWSFRLPLNLSHNRVVRRIHPLELLFKIALAVSGQEKRPCSHIYSHLPSWAQMDNINFFWIFSVSELQLRKISLHLFAAAFFCVRGKGVENESVESDYPQRNRPSTRYCCQKFIWSFQERVRIIQSVSDTSM